MRYRVLLLTVVVAALGVASASGSDVATRASPPPGLTAYGRAVWNLDALLHDTFGDRQVWLNARSSYPRTPANFSTTVVDLAHSRDVVYTFADAHGSAFRLMRPRRAPKPEIGASGWDALLTVRGAYISCGHGKWLYEHGGEAYANWWVGLPAQQVTGSKLRRAHQDFDRAAYSQSSESRGCSDVDTSKASSAVIRAPGSVRGQRLSVVNTTPAWLPPAASTASASGRKSLTFSLTIARPSARANSKTSSSGVPRPGAAWTEMTS